MGPRGAGGGAFHLRSWDSGDACPAICGKIERSPPGANVTVTSKRISWSMQTVHERSFPATGKHGWLFVSVMSGGVRCC